MLPLADIFNHKASLVLLGDAWGVAEVMAHTHRHAGGGDDVIDDDDDDDSPPDDSSQGGDESSQGDSDAEKEAAADEISDGDQDEGQEEEEEGQEEDAQHGFAVGGMPLIAAGGEAAGELSWLLALSVLCPSGAAATCLSCAAAEANGACQLLSWLLVWIEYMSLVCALENATAHGARENGLASEVEGAIACYHGYTIGHLHTHTQQWC